MGKGFTLIELLVVFGIIIVVGSIGLFYYRDYGRKQAVVQAAETLRTNLTQIRQKAFAGELNTNFPCPATNSLTAYQFSYNIGDSLFRINQECTPPGGPPPPPTYVNVATVSLPSNVSLVTGPSVCGNINFKTLGQGTGLSGDCNIYIQGYGYTYSLTVQQSGNIK